MQVPPLRRKKVSSVERFNRSDRMQHLGSAKDLLIFCVCCICPLARLAPGLAFWLGRSISVSNQPSIHCWGSALFLRCLLDPISPALDCHLPLFAFCPLLGTATDPPTHACLTVAIASPRNSCLMDPSNMGQLPAPASQYR